MMGRTSDEEGEPSSTYKSDLEERPLKKARYVWQIKGKYHLKKNDSAQNSNSDPKSSLVDLRPKFKNEANSSIQDKHNKKIPRKIEFEVKSFDTSVTEPLKDSVKKIEKFDAKIVKNDRHIGSVNKNQLLKWQARQMARCYVDNTINTVLEEMGFRPINGDRDMLEEDLQIPENSSDENLEDEAVMMAIHSHGLQRLVAKNQELSKTPKIKNNASSNENHLVTCSCSLSPRVTVLDGLQNLDPFPKRSVIWQRFDFPRENHSEEHHKIYLDALSDSSSCDSTNINDNHKPLRSPLTEINKSESKYDFDDKDEKSCSSFEHNDFMDKAVAVAISKKGLSALSCMEF